MAIYTILFSLFLSFQTNFHNYTEPVDLSGTWEGTVTQGEGGYSSSYFITLYLNDKDGHVTGTSVVGVDDIYAKIEVAGTFKDGLVLTLKDTKILEEKIADKADMEWCIKSYLLILKKQDDQWLLEGHWRGKTSFGACTPGEVFLKRGVDRA
ncbi:MAG TPA: hypothetical protein ENJ45_00940 [Phaeodactylibacter sp.]|nr:hypothetical protein [Phaeodactylibacter sp.]